MSQEMPASSSVDVRIQARAWILDAIIDITLHPLLVNKNSDKTEISQEYIRKFFESCNSWIAKTMKGLNLLSFSMPKDRSSLRCMNEVPVVGILHGSHAVSLQTVQAMFGRINGFATAWTPIYFGPGTPCKAFTDHVKYKTFLETSSTVHTDPIANIRVDIIGNSGLMLAPIHKMKERTRLWTFEGTIDSALHRGLVNEQVLSIDYFRQHLLLSWEQTAVDWELVSIAIQKDCSRLNHRDYVPVKGIYVRGSTTVRLQTIHNILDGIPGLKVTWTPVYVGQGASLASSDVYRAFLATSTQDIADPDPNLMIRVDVKGSSNNALQAKKRGPKGPRKQLDQLDTGSRDETATPPPTLPAAAPRHTSEPSVIPRRQPPPRTVRRSTAAQPC